MIVDRNASLEYTAVRALKRKAGEKLACRVASPDGGISHRRPSNSQSRPRSLILASVVAAASIRAAYRRRLPSIYRIMQIEQFRSMLYTPITRCKVSSTLRNDRGRRRLGYRASRSDGGLRRWKPPPLQLPARSSTALRKGETRFFFTSTLFRSFFPLSAFLSASFFLDSRLL